MRRASKLVRLDLEDAFVALTSRRDGCLALLWLCGARKTISACMNCRRAVTDLFRLTQTSP